MSNNKIDGKWCDKCAHFSASADTGFCERYPPIWINENWMQPRVDKYKSCGEFKPTKDKG